MRLEVTGAMVIRWKKETEDWALGLLRSKKQRSMWKRCPEDWSGGLHVLKAPGVRLWESRKWITESCKIIMVQVRGQKNRKQQTPSFLESLTNFCQWIVRRKKKNKQTKNLTERNSKYNKRNGGQ